MGKVHPTGSLLVAENNRNVMKAIVGRLKKRAEVLKEQSAVAGYREIAELMKNTHERGLSFMGVIRVLNF